MYFTRDGTIDEKITLEKCENEPAIYDAVHIVGFQNDETNFF